MMLSWPSPHGGVDSRLLMLKLNAQREEDLEVTKRSPSRSLWCWLYD